PPRYYALSLHDALPILSFWEVDSEDEVETVAREGGTFALKLISDTVVHKSDLGLVQLNVRSGDVPAVYRRLVAAGRELGIYDGQDRKSTRLNSSHDQIS